jgi:peroxiredoxin
MIMWLFGIHGTTDQAADPEQNVRIVSSLAEAVRRPDGPLLLVFFSLECPVCWAELFEMKYFVEKNSIPIEFVGVCQESRDELQPFLAKFSFFYPVVSDHKKELYRRFRVRLEPHCVILENGRVILEDNTAEDFLLRKEKIVRCLLGIASRSPA